MSCLVDGQSVYLVNECEIRHRRTLSSFVTASAWAARLRYTACGLHDCKSACAVIFPGKNVHLCCFITCPAFTPFGDIKTCKAEKNCAKYCYVWTFLTSVREERTNVKVAYSAQWIKRNRELKEWNLKRRAINKNRYRNSGRGWNNVC